MLTIGSNASGTSRTKSCDAVPGFSLRELSEEARRRGIQVKEYTSKEDLLEAMCSEEVFYHSPLIIYNIGEIVVENVDSQEKLLTYRPYFHFQIAGVSSRGEIVVFETTGESITSHMHLFTIGITSQRRSNVFAAPSVGKGEDLPHLSLIEDKSRDVLLESKSYSQFIPLGVLGTKLVYYIEVNEEYSRAVRGFETKKLRQVRIAYISTPRKSTVLVNTSGAPLASSRGKLLLLGHGNTGTYSFQLFDTQTQESLWTFLEKGIDVSRISLFSESSFGVIAEEKYRVYTRLESGGFEYSAFDETAAFGTSRERVLSSNGNTIEVLFPLLPGQRPAVASQLFEEGVAEYVSPEEAHLVLPDVSSGREVLRDSAFKRINEVVISQETSPGFDEIIEFPDSRVLYHFVPQKKKCVVDLESETVENYSDLDLLGRGRVHLLPVPERDRKELRDFLLDASPLAEVLADIIERFI